MAMMSFIFQYDSNGRLIIVDIQKKKGERGTDLPTMAYYCEKDVGSLNPT